MNRVLDEIRVERESQDMQWGGPEHDDKHLTYDFLEYIEKQRHKCWNQLGHIDADTAWINSRTALIKMAALAHAAVESLDRKHYNE